LARAWRGYAISTVSRTSRAAPEEEVSDEPPPSVAPVGEEEDGERDAFDLAAELADELGEMGGESADTTASPAGDDFQYSVDEVFSEFKKGLEKVVKPEDVETHYDLGIAYKEMGLLDDAVGEFQVAQKGCLGKKKEVDCLTMMGSVQIMKGEHDAAVSSFKQALTSEHSTGEVQKALLYELGAAYEGMGKLGKALFHFNKVTKVDPKYRDIVEVVARLSAKAKPEDDPLPPKSAAKPNGVPPKPPAGAAAPAAKPGAEGAAGKTRKVGYL
jgi:pilus assembly protein FimV